MKADLRRLTPPSWAVSMALAIVSGLGVLAVYALAHHHVPGWEWVLVGVLLLIIGAAHARFATVWQTRTEALIGALRAVVEGSDPASGGGAATAGCGRNRKLKAAMAGLIDSLRSTHQDKRRSELILANMADGIIAVDSERRVTLLNRAAEVILDVTARDVLGRRLVDLDMHPEISRLSDDCLLQCRDATSEIRLPGWPQRVISMRATPLMSGGGAADSAVVILHDLSDLKRHERNQKEFVSNVSHELKTPLTAVRTTAEALLAGAKNDEAVVDRFLYNILSETDRLSVLIEDLMEIARLDSGVTKTERVEVDVARAIRRALDAVKPQAAHKGVSIEVNVEEGLTAFCDEMQITQAIRNLADNAVKYTPEGGHVEVAARAIGGDVRIAVSDTGIGIPHGELDRVFERFYRVDKARSRRLGGTGLGLAIVKEIMKSHGGEVCVETQLGKGSTFALIVPGQGEGDEQ